MTSPDDFDATPAGGRPTSFDDWLQAFKEQASFFTGVKLGGQSASGAPRWPLADVLPVLPLIGAAVGLAAGLVFAIVRSIAGPGWLAAVLAVGAAILITRALHEDGLADTADGLGPHALEPARRLDIMRDSRNGTFGVLALALSVLIKVACLVTQDGSLISLSEVEVGHDRSLAGRACGCMNRRSVSCDAVRTDGWATDDWRVVRTGTTGPYLRPGGPADTRHRSRASALAAGAPCGVRLAIPVAHHEPITATRTQTEAAAWIRNSGTKAGEARSSSSSGSSSRSSPAERRSS